jgi:ubiquinone/menaquinone biosynthesis C-methylase UbiE
MKMTNRRNQVIYRLWAPVYDAILGRFFLPGRKRALSVLGLKPAERLLLVGVGTGADLPLLPDGVEAVGVDLSPEMLACAQARLPLAGRKVTLLQGDAQKLLVEAATFDAVVFNLILSVIPDGRACLLENLRALKPGGRLVVFDKFLPDHGRSSYGRKILNFFANLLGTDLTRRFSEMAAGAPCELICNEPSLLGGAYRIILLKKTA